MQARVEDHSRLRQPKFSQSAAWLPPCIQPILSSGAAQTPTIFLESSKDCVQSLGTEPNQYPGLELILEDDSGARQAASSSSVFQRSEYVMESEKRATSIGVTLESRLHPESVTVMPQRVRDSTERTLSECAPVVKNLSEQSRGLHTLSQDMPETRKRSSACGSKGSSLKKRRSELRDVNVEATVRLAVAAAEGLTIARIMGDVDVLESAVCLQKSRQLIDLDNFSLDTVNSTESDGAWEAGLDDTEMQEAFVDVGILESLSYTSKPSAEEGACNLEEFAVAASDTTNKNTSKLEAQNVELRSITNHSEMLIDVKLRDNGPQLAEKACNEARPTYELDQRNVKDTFAAIPVGVSANVPHRYCSRWFGGWPGTDLKKDVPAAVPKQRLETSYLTEPSETENGNAEEINAFDTAKTLTEEPFKNDFAITQQTKLSEVSVRCSVSSPYDPLCSFVPCSLPLSEVPLQPVANEVHSLLSDKETGFVKGDMKLQGTSQYRRSRVASLRSYSTRKISQGCGTLEQDVLPASVEANERVVHQEPRPLLCTNGKKRRLRASIQAEDISCSATAIEKACNPVGPDKRLTLEACNPADANEQAQTEPAAANYQTAPARPTQNNLSEKSDYKSHKKKLKPEGLFVALEFLLTGFSIKRTAELRKVIEQHDGVVLTNVPPVEVKRTRLMRTRVQRPIVVAPRQVPTHVFLYGCAIGCRPLSASWILECCKSGQRLPKHEYEHALKNAGEDFATRQETRGPIFRGILFLVYGGTSFRSKFTSLIQHGGGQILEGPRGLKSVRKVRDAFSQIIIIEEDKRVPQTLKQSAASLKLPIVSGNWLVESLLCGKLLPVAAISSKHGATDLTLDIVLDSQQADPSWVGRSYVKAPIVPNILDDKLLTRCAGHQSGNGLQYYKEVVFKGVHYSIGDNVEVLPAEQPDTSLSIAHIETLWSSACGGFFMQCRWFFWPRDTGFALCGTPNAIFLSNHCSGSIPVWRLHRKVLVAIDAGGRREVAPEADYRCKFFYDHERQSLHQLTKAAAGT